MCSTPTVSRAYLVRSVRVCVGISLYVCALLTPPRLADGDYVDNIHEKWYYNYRLLESHHGYRLLPYH
jgi:hypothetical protein